MQYFKSLESELQDLSVIRLKALDFIKKRPRVFKRELGINLMRLDLEEFNNSVPEVSALFQQQLGLQLKDVLTFIMWKPEHCGIHKDSWHHYARINIPILNYKNTYTYFYDRSLEEVVTYNAQGRSVVIAKDQQAPHVDYVESVVPIVLRVREFHKVMIPHDNPVPRITLSLGFDKDPIYLLEEQGL